MSQLQSKLRKAQAELAEAEERADLAESSLSRAAGRNRAGGRLGRTVSLASFVTMVTAVIVTVTMTTTKLIF